MGLVIEDDGWRIPERVSALMEPLSLLGPACPERQYGDLVSYVVDFANVSTVGLESSPVAERAGGSAGERGPLLQEQVRPRLHGRAGERGQDATIDWVHRILEEERDLVIASRPLEATAFQVENIRMAYVFYESGLSINVMYTIDDAGKRAVGFKLSDGMEVPEELASRFKFARQKSKLAGTIRGSFFVIKGEY